MPYFCRPCGDYYFSEDGLFKHFQDFRHPYCQKCKIGFADRDEKVEHLRASNVHAYCDVCGRAFGSSESDLQEHFLKEHSAGAGGAGTSWHGTTSIIPMMTICSQCNGVFDYLAWGRHKHENPDCADAVPRGGNQASQSYQSGSLLPCNRCGQEFADKAVLNKHLKDVHKCRFTDGPRRCWKCNAPFQNRAALGVHHDQHPSHNFYLKFKKPDATSKYSNPIPSLADGNSQCFVCHQTFEDSTALKVHYSVSSHRNCRICDERFDTFRKLESHFHEEHVYNTCGKCQSDFFDHENFERHLASNRSGSNCTKCEHQFPSICEKIQHRCTRASGAGENEHGLISASAKQNVQEKEYGSHKTHATYGSLNVGLRFSKYAQSQDDSPASESYHSSQDSRPPTPVSESVSHSVFIEGGSAAKTENTSRASSHSDHQEEEKKPGKYIPPPLRFQSLSNPHDENVHETSEAKLPSGPRDLNVLRPRRLETPRATPQGTNESVLPIKEKLVVQKLEEKSEPKKQSNEQVRLRTSHKIACGACSEQFSTNSDMATHMESGSCLDDDETGMYPLVLHFDKARSFTVPGLIDYLDGSITRVKISNESHHDKLNMSYNCPYCEDTSFDKSEGLDAHLRGPLHDMKVYRCPGSGCGQRFSRMGNLLRHVENSDCRMGFIDGLGGMADLKNFVNVVLRSGAA